MIEFKKDQEKIYLGKNKITLSPHDNYMELHLVYSNNITNEKSGYRATDELGLCINEPDYRERKEEMIKLIEKDKKRGIEFKMRTPYNGKFVRVVSFENKYTINFIKEIKSDYFEDELGFICFEGGGYPFNKKSF